MNAQLSLHQRNSGRAITLSLTRASATSQEAERGKCRPLGKPLLGAKLNRGVSK